MILKTLVTGVAAAAVVAAAAGGVTSMASNASSGAPSVASTVEPVVLGIPLPQDPAPDLQGPLVQTLSALVGPGSYSGAKGTYVQGGFGRATAILADRKYNQKAQEGYFPVTFVVADIDQNGPVATANVTATAATGATANQPVTFVQGPSPTGWQISESSVSSLLASFS